MALSDTEVEAIHLKEFGYVATGLGQFARAIEAEVRKQDDALIPQLIPGSSAMSSDSESKRRTQSLDTRRSRIYQRISAVWDQLGPEFKASELYALTGIKNVFANRILVASVLFDSFGCTIVEDYTTRRRWRKGNK